tara:strand:+ start:1237 stop:2112 length:876 start_codon:yes stop_codon:yes gene_type:complete
MISKFEKIYTLSKPEITSSPIILTSPHSGRIYPDEYISKTNFDEQKLRVFEDNYVDKIINFNLNYDCKLLISEIPRVIIDLNRNKKEIDKEMFFNFDNLSTINTNKVRSGIGVFPRLLGLDQIYKKKMDWLIFEKIINDVYDLWHDTLKKEIIDTKSLFKRVVLLDCHSMPSYDRDGNKFRNEFPEFVIGDLWGNSSDRDLVNFICEFLKEQGFNVSRNTPYAGAYILDNYGNPNQGVSAIQIEIRKDLYFDEKEFKLNDNFENIRVVMQKLIENLSSMLYNLDYYERSAE